MGEHFIVKSTARLAEAEKHARMVVSGLSVLRQISERLELPTDASLHEELLAMAKAQRRVLRIVHRQLEADPLFAHLLKSRIDFRQENERRTKSGKRLDDLVCSTFYLAQSLGFRGDFDAWRKLLAIFPS